MLYCDQCLKQTEHTKMNSSKSEFVCIKCVLPIQYYKKYPSLNVWQNTPQGCVPPDKKDTFEETCWKNAVIDNVQQDRKRVLLYCDHPTTNLTLS